MKEKEKEKNHTQGPCLISMATWRRLSYLAIHYQRTCVDGKWNIEGRKVGVLKKKKDWMHLTKLHGPVCVPVVNTQVNQYLLKNQQNKALVNNVICRGYPVLGHASHQFARRLGSGPSCFRGCTFGITDLYREREQKHLKSSNLAPTLVHFSSSLLGTLSLLKPRCRSRRQRVWDLFLLVKKKKATDDALKCWKQRRERASGGLGEETQQSLFLGLHQSLWGFMDLFVAMYGWKITEINLWPLNYFIELSGCVAFSPPTSTYHRKRSCDQFHAAGESAEGHIPQDSHDNSQHSQTTGTTILRGTKGKHDERKYGDLHQEKNSRVWKNTWIAAKDKNELHINTYYRFICWDSKLFMVICNSEIKSS